MRCCARSATSSSAPRWVQPVGATWSDPSCFRRSTMARTGRPGLSAEQKRELWTRWKNGQSLSDLGRALGKHLGPVFGVVLAKGGIAPPLRKRSRLALTLAEREEVSRGLMAGRSYRQIADQLARAPSTIS